MEDKKLTFHKRAKNKKTLGFMDFTVAITHRPEAYDGIKLFRIDEFGQYRYPIKDKLPAAWGK